MSQDSENSGEESEVFFVQEVKILDKTDLPNRIKMEIYQLLVSLNTTELEIQVNSASQMLINHEDTHARFALAPKEIWKVICEYNEIQPISESYSVEQKSRFIDILRLEQ